ncbi:MAG: hypothetical protein WB630_20945 [Candidatus Acidiferrales bacterium]
MTKRFAMWFSLLTLMVSAPALMAQTKPEAEKTPPKAAAKAQTAQEENIEEYIKLLRQDIGAEKAKLMGSVMQLDAEDAAKFWPLYRDYSAELNKINDLRVANILEYSRTYTQMTDEKADQLIKNAMEYQKQRFQLLAKYYELMKDQLGAITAARFVQVEHQLLLLIDLKVDSALPVVGS